MVVSFIYKIIRFQIYMFIEYSGIKTEAWTSGIAAAFNMRHDDSYVLPGIIFCSLQSMKFNN